MGLGLGFVSLVEPGNLRTYKRGGLVLRELLGQVTQVTGKTGVTRILAAGVHNTFATEVGG